MFDADARTVMAESESIETHRPDTMSEKSKLNGVWPSQHRLVVITPSALAGTRCEWRQW